MPRKKRPVWNVLYGRWGADQIEEVDIFSFGQVSAIVDTLKKEYKKHRKEMKGQADTKKAQKAWMDHVNKVLKSELFYYFWAKCEHEIIVHEWPPHVNTDRLKDAVSKHLGKKELAPADVFDIANSIEFAMERKVDVYTQLMMNYEHFSKLLFEYAGVI